MLCVIQHVTVNLARPYRETAYRLVHPSVSAAERGDLCLLFTPW